MNIFLTDCCFQVVKPPVEKLAIFPFPTMVLHTMAAWLILEIIGAQLIQAGEFALALSLATITYNDDGMWNGQLEFWIYKYLI